ncbi:MAG: N-acetylmuramic acid 6-phosphate etherase [Bacteroidia bacterium]
MEKVTESASKHRHLERMSTAQLLEGINGEDQTVADSVAAVMPQIEALVDSAYEKMKDGGRLFYLGSGTSGRLGIVDASECPPTFGVDHGIVVGLIAGGDAAIRKAQEFAEDDMQQGFKDLEAENISSNDFVIGISASGTTPYVLGALKTCVEKGIPTGCICCNAKSPIAEFANYPIEVVVGPEFVTGSTRMKSGTAQKLVLNMISTSLMIKLGRVKDNKMVDMQLSNKKLIDRGTKMIVQLYSEISYENAKEKLLELGSVRNVIHHLENS